jgi:hypothetical protein
VAVTSAIVLPGIPSCREPRPALEGVPTGAGDRCNAAYVDHHDLFPRFEFDAVFDAVFGDEPARSGRIVLRCERNRVWCVAIERKAK